MVFNGIVMRFQLVHLKSGLTLFSTVLVAEFEGVDIRDEPAYFCSHNCDHEFEFRVCDAVQATMASPSYFPFCRIGNRYFIDGGFGHNNPSFDVYKHYTSIQGNDVFPSVDMNQILLVNIGTGIDRLEVKQADENPRLQSLETRVKRRWQSLTGMPNMLRQMNSHTPNAQMPFYLLKATSRASGGMLDIHRFSADTGLHKIKLDKYRELKEIEKLTNEYIDRPDICNELIEVAEKLVQGWRAKQNLGSVSLVRADGDDIAPRSMVDIYRLPDTAI
jgi:patatin-like phospholipase/acyl hydrolase